MAATEQRGTHFAGVILVIAVATIAAAWTFEAAGFAPCELCLAQRWPYYAGIPLAGLTVVLSLCGARRPLTAAFAALALVFAGSAVFGAYHAGVEWGFWPGPAACSGAFRRVGSVDDFLQQLNNVRVVRCDSPALRVFGLSLAGWNGLVSAGLAGLAIWGAGATLRK